MKQQQLRYVAARVGKTNGELRKALIAQLVEEALVEEVVAPLVAFYVALVEAWWATLPPVYRGLKVGRREFSAQMERRVRDALEGVLKRGSLFPLGPCYSCSFLVLPQARTAECTTVAEGLWVKMLYWVLDPLKDWVTSPQVASLGLLQSAEGCLGFRSLRLKRVWGRRYRKSLKPLEKVLSAYSRKWGAFVEASETLEEALILGPSATEVKEALEAWESTVAGGLKA